MTPQYRKGIRVKIVFDEEKIAKEGKYSLNKMNAAVEAEFAEKGFRKEGNLFVGPGTEQDFAHGMLVCMACGRADWFLENVRVWRWYNGSHEENLLEDSTYYKVGFRS